jgi:DNA-binding NtrC family response regulator
MKLRVLVVDDEAAQRNLVGGFLKKQGYSVTTAGSAEEAVSAAAGKFFEIAVLDMKLPGKTGLELLTDLKKTNPDIQAVFVTAFGTLETAVEAMKAGAFDFLTKPVDLAHLLAILNKAGEKHLLLDENKYLREKLEESYRDSDIIAESPAMKEIFSTVARVAQSDSTVLIHGESGTGKELIARALHRAGRRCDKNFIAINCAAVPETLLEAELFGAERGAYTGATTRRIGRFELADGGTLFLDEVGDMPASIQAKLLRVLELKSFERLGGNETVETDVRVLAATHQDLQRKISEGSFRSDLYYRLNVIQIILPPLRTRPEDILPLVDKTIKRQNAKLNKNITGITASTKDILLGYAWPGNVRELLNLVERACVLSRRDVLDVDDFPIPAGRETGMSGATVVQDINTPLKTVERNHILRVLEAHDWQVQQSADILGVHRNTLRLKMKEYDIGLNK